MARIDRIFDGMRQRALENPMTRANRMVFPNADLPGGVSMALSFNL